MPWVIGGVVIGAVGLLLLSVAESAVTMVLAWSLVQLALNAAWAGGTAAVPDQVPVARRGLIGGMIAIAGTVGVLLGILGLMGSLFIRPRRAWVRAGRRGDGRTVVELAGLDRLATALSGELGDQLAELLAPEEVDATRARLERLRRTAVFPHSVSDWHTIPWPPF